MQNWTNSSMCMQNTLSAYLFASTPFMLLHLLSFRLLLPYLLHQQPQQCNKAQKWNKQTACNAKSESQLCPGLMVFPICVYESPYYIFWHFLSTFDKLNSNEKTKFAIKLISTNTKRNFYCANLDKTKKYEKSTNPPSRCRLLLLYYLARVFLVCFQGFFDSSEHHSILGQLVLLFKNPFIWSVWVWANV